MKTKWISLPVALLFYLLATLFLNNCQQPASKLSNKISEKEMRSQMVSALDSFFEAWIDTTDIPGLAIAVTLGDSLIYAKGFGVKNLETNEPLHPYHIFHTASLSKPLAATAVVKLAEQGKLNLNERLTTYLPYFKLADPHYKDITIFQILNHTSGMPDVEDYQWDKPQLDEGTAERYVRSLSGEKLLSKPGKEFHYSNMAFDVLADVVAKLSGQSFESYVKTELFQTLGMNESSFYQPEIRLALRTSPHIGNPPTVSKIYPYNRRHAPSSTLNSSVLELSNLLIADLNRGVFKGKHILKPEYHDLLMTPSFTIDKEKGYTVGLSWFIGPYKECSQIILHSGLDLGYSSFLTMIPDKKMGFVILSNYDQTPVEQINFQILDLLLDALDRK